MNNLEHGWLLMAEKEENKGEIIGYCECCDEPIYENDNYAKRWYGYLCEKCEEIERKAQEELETDYED